MGGTQAAVTACMSWYIAAVHNALLAGGSILVGSTPGIVSIKKAITPVEDGVC